MEVPTIYKAYFSGPCKGISPQNMVLYEIPIDQLGVYENGYAAMPQKSKWDDVKY